ncbi:MAG: MFS transporter, partial [Dehalococcoidia bacterium]
MLREQWQRNLAGILVAGFVSILGFNLVFPFLPLYIQSLGSYTTGEAAFWTGIIGLVTGIVGSVAALVWGQLADRRGRKPMLIRATAGAALGLVTMGVSQNIGHLLVGRAVFSALAGTVPAANPLIASHTPPEHLSMAIGSLQSAVYLSNMLGPLVGGALASTVGYRYSFLLTAAVYVASALPVVWLVRERFTPPAAPRGLVAGMRADFRDVLRDESIALPMVAALFALLGANVVSPIIALLVRELVGAARAEALSGVAFGVQGLTSAVAALSVGRLVARWGYRRLLRVTGPVTMATFLAMWAAPNYQTLVALMALSGAMQGMQAPALSALIAAR